MTMRLNHELKEEITNQNNDFPISYFHDELVEFAYWQGPLHWHVDFEIATALDNILDFQVGSQHINLQAGDSIFINGNILHGIKQVSGEKADSMPNIVFSPALFGLQDSAIYEKYVFPILQCDSLQFIVFKHDNTQQARINAVIHEIYELLQKKPNCYELKVQRNINEIFEFINTNFDQFEKREEKRTHISMQIRLQKMMTFIQENYQDAITLVDIANSAHISKSEANLCFNLVAGCTPIEALIKHRLQIAQQLLQDKNNSLQSISEAVGFNSANYFSRMVKKYYNVSPKYLRELGK